MVQKVLFDVCIWLMDTKWDERIETRREGDGGVRLWGALGAQHGLADTSMQFCYRFFPIRGHEQGLGVVGVKGKCHIFVHKNGFYILVSRFTPLKFQIVLFKDP